MFDSTKNSKEATFNFYRRICQ